MRLPRGPLPWLTLSLLTLLSSCGAGLIGGIAANEGGSTTAAVRPPQLSIAPVLPLVPVASTERTVLVANAALPTGAALQVELIAAGVTVPQGSPVASGQGASTAIQFTLDTTAIVAAVGATNTVAADVPGVLRVLVAGREVAPPVAVVLARQPVASLSLGTQTARFVSPLGERVQIRVQGLRHTNVGDLQVFAAVRDPSSPIEPGQAVPRIVRLCTGLALLPGATVGDLTVDVSVPGNAFPDRVELVVHDAVSGRSTQIDNAFYRPEVALALPSQGATTGGSLVTLIGTALVPHDFTVLPGPPPLAFDAVEILLRKGGRETLLPAQDFRVAESGRDRLVFAVPASPDGRPGQVDIVLRTQLEGAAAEVIASNRFLYANPDPFFGPRGAVLQQAPVAVVPIALDAAPNGDDAPDFAVLTEEGGVGFLQLLLAQENGMFQRFSARQRIGDHQVPAERSPRDLCSGDFDGDGVPDLFVANAGATSAVHHLVLGQARPATPLGAIHPVAGAPGTARCRTGDFDGDGRPDLLLVPGGDAPAGLRPQVRLARPQGPGAPAFAAELAVPVRAMPYEAVEVADLDGDGHLDVAVLSGTLLQLDVAYGRGDGSFDPAVPLDFTIPFYSPDPASPAVGLHACRDGTQQSLGIVIAGLLASPLGSGPTPPSIAVLRQPTPRTFLAPVASEVTLSPTEPLAQSLAADLDRSNTLELVLAVGGDEPEVALGMLRFGANGFQPTGRVERGAESPRQIRALHFARAFPASAPSGEVLAVFVVHESLVDGARERRLSTRLVFAEANGNLVLLPADANAPVDGDVEALTVGNFHPISVAGAGAVRDMALARSGEVQLLRNDGFGGFPAPSNRLGHSGLLPRTVTRLPGAAGENDALLFADASSRFGFWRHQPNGSLVQVADALTGELRLQLGAPFATASLTDRTRLAIADVDGDGVADLVTLLVFDLPVPAEDSSRLLLWRGKPSPQAGEFPFLVPTVATPVHGNATEFTLGDFAAVGPGQPRRLELALAVPYGVTNNGIDGDHVRFFRYQAGGFPDEDRFVRSSVTGGGEVLLAGSRPTRLASDDFDGDGLVDLLVAAAGDGVLRLFRNIAPVLPVAGEVAVDQFVERQSSAQQLPGGVPTALRLGDVNGDGSIDAIAVGELALLGGGRSTTVSFYLSTSPGSFGERGNVSPSRIGDRDAVLALDLGDWNRDGVLDLFVGWNTHGAQDFNVRVLLGGSR